MTPPVINSQEQYEVALASAQRTLRKQLGRLRDTYTVRLRDEAWGDPDKAKAIGDEWDAEITRLTDECKAKMAAIPKPPPQEMRR